METTAAWQKGYSAKEGADGADLGNPRPSKTSSLWKAGSFWESQRKAFVLQMWKTRDCFKNCRDSKAKSVGHPFHIKESGTQQVHECSEWTAGSDVIPVF